MPQITENEGATQNNKQANIKNTADGKRIQNRWNNRKHETYTPFQAPHASSHGSHDQSER